MARTRAMILFFALVCGVGCQHTNQGRFPMPDGSGMVTFQVHGMMKAKSGAT
ncbi:MAG: hypothetical protein IID34_05935 [Planctomycetes bacterium]|nr:hypothetical protein [Planctomycetota bacterium]MCH8968305.1 hypothetical protein [Planctomycetota bacterium]